MPFSRRDIFAVAMIATQLSYAASFSVKPPLFSSTRSIKRPPNVVQLCGGGSDDDPTKVWYAGIANGIQNILTNSPLKEGKKAIVRALAGEYDEEAVRAKLRAYIEGSPVVMLSFTT